MGREDLGKWWNCGFWVAFWIQISPFFTFSFSLFQKMWHLLAELSSHEQKSLLTAKFSGCSTIPEYDLLNPLLNHGLSANMYLPIFIKTFYYNFVVEMQSSCNPSPIAIGSVCSVPEEVALDRRGTRSISCERIFVKWVGTSTRPSRQNVWWLRVWKCECGGRRHN